MKKYSKKTRKESPHVRPKRSSCVRRPSAVRGKQWATRVSIFWYRVGLLHCTDTVTPWKAGQEWCFLFSQHFLEGLFLYLIFFKFSISLLRTEFLELTISIKFHPLRSRSPNIHKETSTYTSILWLANPNLGFTSSGGPHVFCARHCTTGVFHLRGQKVSAKCISINLVILQIRNTST